MGKEILKQLVANRKVLMGGIIFLFVLSAAVLAPFISPHDPLEQSLRDYLKPPAWEERGMGKYFLGTDNLGRDILSRIIYGARISVLIGVFTVSFSCLIGTFLGLISGYYRGKVDEVIMRMVDIMLSFPTILLAIAIMAALGFGLVKLIVALTVTRWLTYCRVVRATTMSLREREFVESVKAIGVDDRYIILREILPNCAAPIIVMVTFEMALVIIFEAMLSFLGIGVEPGVPTWGGMLNAGRNYMYQAWWLATFPGLAIFACVLGINLLGDGLRDVLDPRLRTD